MYFPNSYEEYMIDPSRRRPKSSNLLGMLMPENAGNILDIGLGNGEDLYHWKYRTENNIEIWGLDLKEKENKLNLDSLYKQGVIDIQGNIDIELPDNYFDCIAVKNTLEYLQDPISFLNVISKKLKTGGVLLLSYANFSNVVSLSKLLSGYMDRGYAIDDNSELFVRNRLSPLHISNLLAEIGFQIGTHYPEHIFSSSKYYKFFSWLEKVGLKNFNNISISSFNLSYIKVSSCTGTAQTLVSNQISDEKMYQDLSALLQKKNIQSNDRVLVIVNKEFYEENVKFDNSVVKIISADKLIQNSTVANSQEYNHIIAYHAIDKVINPSYVLNIIRSMLTDNGELTVINMNASYWKRVLKFAFINEIPVNKFSHNELNSMLFTKYSLKRILKNSGFDNINYTEEANLPADSKNIIKDIGNLFDIHKQENSALLSNLSEENIIVSCNKNTAQIKNHNLTPLSLLYFSREENDLNINKFINQLPVNSDITLVVNDNESCLSAADLLSKQFRIKILHVKDNNMKEIMEEFLNFSSHNYFLILNSNVSFNESVLVNTYGLAYKSNIDVMLPISSYELEYNKDFYMPKWIDGSWSIDRLDELFSSLYSNNLYHYNGLGSDNFLVRRDVFQNALLEINSLSSTLWSLELFDVFRRQERNIIQNTGSILDVKNFSRINIHSKLNDRKSFIDNSKEVYDKFAALYAPRDIVQLIGCPESDILYNIKDHWEQMLKNQLTEDANKELNLSVPGRSSIISDVISVRG